jgi:hypothetical protein
VPGVAEYLDRSAIRAILDLERGAGRLEPQAAAERHRQHHVAVELDRHAVLQVGFLQRCARGAGVKGQDRRERGDARAVSFDAERRG